MAALGCIVVLATAIALMVPALSMTRGALVCGLEEHQHSETCYQKVLACGQDESADHVHTDACYERRLACELPEHAHGDACYERVVVQGEGVDGEQDAADAAGNMAYSEADSAIATPNLIETPDRPQQSFQQDIVDENGAVTLSVSVEAPESALPEGSTMVVTPVEDNDSGTLRPSSSAFELTLTSGSAIESGSDGLHSIIFAKALAK